MKDYKILPVIIISILLLSIYLPEIYKSMFVKRVDNTAIYYSPAAEEFIKATVKKGRYRNIVYSSIDDKREYSEDEFRRLLPFRYFYSLIATNNFPQKFQEFTKKQKLIKKELRYIRLRPKKINSKSVNLYPLFESSPKYGVLTFPNDMFRLSEKGITFIDTITNSENKQKSAEYNNIFLKLGAKFPLKYAFGNPTTRKPFDEGYFILDSIGQLFHLKMELNMPVINKIDTNGIDIKYILVKEHISKEFYAIAVSKDSNIYLIMYDNYKLKKLPLEHYDYKTMLFKIYTTPINRVVTTSYTDYKSNEKVIRTMVLDMKYNKIKENIYKYTLNNSLLYETIKSLIFPYTLYIKQSKEFYATLEIKNINFNSFILYFIISILYILYIKFKNEGIKNHIIPSILIFTSGIYAIISLIMFEIIPIRKKR